MLILWRARQRVARGTGHKIRHARNLDASTIVSGYAGGTLLQECAGGRSALRGAKGEARRRQITHQISHSAAHPP
jgi:hypothetical protein